MEGTDKNEQSAGQNEELKDMQARESETNSTPTEVIPVDLDDVEDTTEEELAGIPKKWNELNDKTKKGLEIFAGVLLALACGFFLFRSGQNSDNMWALFASAGIALLLPRMLETQLSTKLMWMRRTMLIGLVIIIVAMVVMAAQSGGLFA